MTRRYIFLLLTFIATLSLAQTEQESEKLIKKAVIEANKQNHIESMEMLNKIKKNAVQHKWYKIEFLALNNIGLNQYMLLDYGAALENYIEAYKLALLHLTHEEEMIALNNIAVLYLREKNFQKAEEYFLKAYEIAEKHDMKDKQIIHSVNLTSLGVESKNTFKAKKYFQKATELIDSKSFFYPHYKILEAEILFLNKQYIEAKNLALELLPTLNAETMSENIHYLLLLLGNVEMNAEDYPAAIAYLKQIIKDPKASLDNKKVAFNQLSQAYQKLKDFDQALVYKDSVLNVNDKINTIKNSKLFEVNKIKLELNNQQLENKKAQEKSELERKIFIATVSIILLLAFGIFWALRNRSIHLKQKSVIAENNQRIMELELQKQISDKELLEQKIKEQDQKNLLSQEKLKHEIEQKNRQLAVKALSSSARNEILDNIIKQISIHKEFTENKNLNKLLIELKNHLKTDSNWDEFFTHFEEVNQGFIKNIKQKHPELNTNDLRFISYYYMNLTTKEIATLLNITIEACRKRKERVTKKLNLCETQDLYDYIASFESEHNKLIMN